MPRSVDLAHCSSLLLQSNELEHYAPIASTPRLHLLNWGMGVESTAILVRWILEPRTRPFASFEQFIVLVAQTGDEMLETKHLCETFLFPLVRSQGIRVVQVARASASKLDGYVVLSDTTEPDELHIEGHFALSEDMLASGTAPRLGRPHICAMRSKGEVLDAWIGDHVAEAFVPYLGYNAEETKRAGKADGYTSQGQAFVYPLIEWGWSCDDCIDYLYRVFGVIWRKSACFFCPFQSKGSAIARYQRDPEAGARTLLLERNALAFNPRMHLFTSGTAYDLIAGSGNEAVLTLYEALLESHEWAIYHVQRLYRQVGSGDRKYVNADRRVVTIAKGERPAMETNLAEIAAQYDATVEELHGSRFYLRTRREGVYPSGEEFFVVAPCLARDKVRNAKSFDLNWQEFTGEIRQLSLLEAG